MSKGITGSKKTKKFIQHSAEYLKDTTEEETDDQRRKNNFLRKRKGSGTVTYYQYRIDGRDSTIMRTHMPKTKEEVKRLPLKEQQNWSGIAIKKEENSITAEHDFQKRVYKTKHPVRLVPSKEESWR